MAPERRITLPATTEDLDEALDYASKLEYAFAVRPPVESPSRRRWEIHFKQDLYALISQLAKAEFKHLPAFAMGCIWLHNHARHNGVPFDPEAIRRAEGDHPALKGPGMLKYKPAEDGPNGLRPENELRSVWWDTFRAEANERGSKPRKHAPETAGSTVQGAIGTEGIADGERTSRGSSRRGAPTATAAPVEPQSAPATSEAPHTRSRTGRSRPPSTKPVKEVPEGDSLAELSEKAAGKRRAATRGDTRRAAPSSTQGTMTLKDIQPEKINDVFVDHPRPCARCSRKRQKCLFNPLFKSSCQSCVTAKAACSLRFDVKKDHIIAAYFRYAYFKMLTTPSVFAVPDFSPTDNPKTLPLPTRDSIQWYTEQYNASDSRPETQAKAAEPPEEAPPETSRKARRQGASKSSAASEVPEASARGSQGARTYVKGPTRAPSRSSSRAPSRAPSAASSTLHETPASAATSPPASPSAPSSTSHIVPSKSVDGTEGAKSNASEREVGKTASRTRATRSHGPASASRKSPRTRQGSASVSLPDELASMDEQDLTLAPSDSAVQHDGSFDIEADASDFAAGPSEIEADTEGDGSATEDDTAAIDPRFPQHPPERSASSKHRTPSPTQSDVKEVPDAHGGSPSVTGVAPREPVPGLLTLQYNQGLGKQQVNAIHPPRTQLTFPTTHKTAPTPPARPSPAAPPSHRHFRVPPINGTWRGLRRLGEHNRNGQYAILPPPAAPFARPPPASTNQHAAPVARHEPADGGGEPDRPATPPNCQFVFSKEVHQLARDTKARYTAVSALAAALEHDGTRLAQRASGILDRHAQFASKIEVSRTWGEGVIPLIAQSTALVKVVHEVVEIVAHIKSVVAGICDTFNVVPPIPANWVALAEIIETGRKLQDLYRFTWAKIDQLVDDVRPLREETASLQVNLQSLDDRMESLQNDMEDSVAPLFRNLSRSLSETIGGLSSRVDVLDGTAAEADVPADAARPRRPGVGDVVAALTALTERLGRIEDRLAALEDADKEDDEDGSETEEEEEEEEEEDVEESDNDANNAAARPVSATRSRSSRETQEPSAELIHKHVATYLAAFGIGEDSLRRLAMQSYYSGIPGPSTGSISTSPAFNGGGLTGAFQNRWGGTSGASMSTQTGAGDLHPTTGATSSLAPSTTFATESAMQPLVDEGSGSE